jgi:hypothetical protein
VYCITDVHGSIYNFVLGLLNSGVGSINPDQPVVFYSFNSRKSYNSYADVMANDSNELDDICPIPNVIIDFNAKAKLINLGDTIDEKPLSDECFALQCYLIDQTTTQRIVKGLDSTYPYHNIIGNHEMNLAIPRGDLGRYRQVNYKGLVQKDSGTLGVKGFDGQHKMIYSMLSNIVEGESQISIFQKQTGTIFAHTPFNIDQNNITDNYENSSISGLLISFYENYNYYLSLFDKETRNNFIKKEEIIDLLDKVSTVTISDEETNLEIENINKLNFLVNTATRAVAAILLKNFDEIYEAQSCYTSTQDGKKIELNDGMIDEIVNIPNFHLLLNAVADTASAVNTNFNYIEFSHEGSGFTGVT